MSYFLGLLNNVLYVLFAEVCIDSETLHNYAKNLHLLLRQRATAKMFISLKIQQNVDFSCNA